MKFGCPELSEKMFDFLGPIKPSRPWSKEVVCDNEGNITVATDGRKFLTKMQLSKTKVQTLCFCAQINQCQATQQSTFCPFLTLSLLPCPTFRIYPPPAPSVQLNPVNHPHHWWNKQRIWWCPFLHWAHIWLLVLYATRDKYETDHSFI